MNNGLLSDLIPKVKSKPYVLAVEDDKDNLLILKYVIEGLNCTCLDATNGQTAFLLAKKYQPKLILLDILLPDCNGFELIARFKNHRQTRQASIVAVTGLILPEQREQMFQAGCDSYLSKPYLIDDLKTQICHYLNLPKISPYFSFSMFSNPFSSWKIQRS